MAVYDYEGAVVSELYDVLGIAKANGCKQVVMEVSSEALLHNRVEGIKYSVVGFTNITEDHLNVHGSLGNYIECKLKLQEIKKDEQDTKSKDIDFIISTDNDEEIEIKDFLAKNKFSNKLITFYLHNKHLIKLNNHELNRYNLTKDDELNITINELLKGKRLDNKKNQSTL